MRKAVALRVVKPRLATILIAITFAGSVVSLAVAQSQSGNGSVGVQIMPSKTTVPPLGGLEGYGVGLPGSDSVPPAERGQAASRQFFVAPIPVSSQAFGIGVVPIVGLVFPISKADTVSPPSLVMAGGFFTSGGSKALGTGTTLNWLRDRFRTTLFAAYADLSYEVFGVGNAAGNTSKSIEVNQKGAFVYGQQLVGLGSGFFLGPRFIRAHITSTFDLSQVVPPNLDPILDQFQVPITISSLGFDFQHDRRDSMFYPRTGHFLEVKGDYYARPLGSDRVYNSYSAAFNKYVPTTANSVLALRVSVCAVTGSNVPFFAYCQFGQQGDNRGYQSGRYRDLRMIATQAEWRTTLYKRIGGTVFLGIGEVATEFSAFNFHDLLPSGGLGLRFNLLKRDKLNLRSDFAYSTTGFSWSMGIGEVF